MASDPHTALVTGATRGIGREVARQLAAKGWRVFIGARDLAKAEAAARELGLGAEALWLDVSSRESIHAAAANLSSRTERLDALINNAAILLDDSGPDVTTTEIETLAATLETNVYGPLRLAQAFLPLLEKGRHRRIVNVSSGGGQLSEGMGTWAPAYCISKTALNAVTVQLHATLHPRGFCVNSVSPGWVRTAMGGPNAPLSVEEGADSIVWLAAEAPADLSGAFIRERQVIAW
jgi:NAD(P)-dependent dehydrogenase (short-subunit alcohol dehydrogenase family)